MSGAFAGIVRFEVAYYLRRISTWLYFGILLAVGFLLMNAVGGAWENAVLSIGGSGGNVKANSPYVVAVLVSVLSAFGVLVTAALLGNSAYRDYETGIHPLFFTAPVSRLSYLGGRFTGGLLVNALVFLGIPLGVMLGSLMPYLDQERIGAFRLASYLHPYLVVVLPNLLFTGAVFFALAALTRQILPNHVGGVILLVGNMLAGDLAKDLGTERTAALLDPFGAEALALVTKYWTPAERNTLLVPLEDVALWNRLLWMAVGVAVFALVYSRFRFSHLASEGRRGRKAAAEEAGPAHARPGRLEIPAARRAFGARAQLAQYLSVTRRAFWGIVANRYFVAIVGAGLVFLVVSASEVGKMFGTTTWPVTYSVLELLGASFTLFMLIVITFYAGELVWSERDVRLHQVHDATPLPNWVPFAAKLSALALVVVLLQAVILVAGVLTQAAKGYTRFELGLYLETLFGLQLADYLLLCVLVLLVHTLVNNKYLGHMVVVLFYLFTLFMDEFGLEHNLYEYGSDARYQYSDMNGHGPFVAPFFWFKAYWGAWALLFVVLSILFWVRGEETGGRWRMRLARLRYGRSALVATATGAALVLGLGGFIFYNTNVLNEYRTSYQEERAAAEYEKRYKRYEGVPQPRVVGVKLAVDLFPEERDVTVRGTYRLRNRTSIPIDSLHLHVSREVEVRSLQLSRPARRVLADREREHHVYRLEQPLAPGDSLRLDFRFDYEKRGFENELDDLRVVENGTFVSGPGITLGYDARAELADDQTRKKHGLRPKERMPRVDDPKARMNTYVSSDADWVDFEAVVSTSTDQIAVAPGYLQREWTEGGRRYFHYRMDAPILNFYSFLSARYAIRRDVWKAPPGAAPSDVAIEVYYDPKHPYNVDRMIHAAKKSLDYFTRHFGAYQHRQVRILEFPRYQTFAQSFPNTIPYSEGIGFIARVEDEDDIDYPLYVTAHEVAHQWWAHQVIGGNVQGSTLMSETLAGYSGLMVMEKEYGRDHMRRFLEYQLDRYLVGRTVERKKELPLVLAENQPYIHYGKGAVVMYALRDYIGEERLNAALARYVRDKRFQQPPYTNSLEFLDYVRAATPDSLQYVVTDFFERIVLYDNRAKSAAYTRLPDGRYEVTLEVAARKVRADSLGEEAEVPMNDLVDVGVFASGKEKGDLGAPLYLRKHRVGSGTRRIRVVVDGVPARAGMDPYQKLIDRHTDDNTVAAEAKGGRGR